MKLTIVGSAPAYSRQPGHASSCYLVESGDTAVAMDLGQGAFAALNAYRIPSSLAAVFVTHLHPDHHVDLVALRHYLHFEADGQQTLPLRAPALLRERIDALHGQNGFLDGLPGDDLESGIHEVGDLAIEARPVTHALNSHAFRVAAARGGPGLVYSGDCGREDDLLPLIRRGDTLLCEASWGAAATPPVPDLHLTAEQAARAARDGGAARLILTHVMERFEPERALARAREVFDGPMGLAEPGMTLEIG